MTQLFDCVFLSGSEHAENSTFLHSHSISLIINCAKEVESKNWVSTLHLPLDDAENENILQHLDTVCKAMEKNEKNILVHCAAGVS